jgi:hypothetical protein
MADTPMSPERLEEIRRAHDGECSRGLTFGMEEDILDEVDRLREENRRATTERDFARGNLHLAMAEGDDLRAEVKRLRARLDKVRTFWTE